MRSPVSVSIQFDPGLLPVLKHGNHNQKDHAGKGRARSDDEIAGLAQQRAGIGKVLDKSVVGEDGVGYVYRGERHSLDEVNPTGAARIISEQGWDAPAQSVDQATFDRLAQRDDLVTVYRGGPVGLEKGMVDGTPFIGDGKSGPGTYVTTDRERANRFADRWVKTGEDENGRAVHDIYQGNVVPMLMPKSMYDNPGNGEMNRVNIPLTNEGLNGVGVVTGFMGSDRVVWNTGAMIVGPPVPSVGNREYVGRWNLNDVAKALNEPPTDGEMAFYKIENGRVILLYAEEGGPVTGERMLKHGRHDQSSHGRRGGTSAAEEVARREAENVDYLMGRTVFPPAWSGGDMTTFVPPRSLGDRVQSARRRIREWKRERARQELARMTPAELERLGAANRARAAAERAARMSKAVDPVYEILQRLLGDVVEPSLWIELIEDPRPIGEIDGPLGDLLDEMLQATAPTNTVIKFAPGLRPVLKHGNHNQKDHAGKSGANSHTTAETKPVGSLDGVPFGSDYISDINYYIQEPNPPAVLYHVAPKSARAEIARNGLDPADRTWNTGAGAGEEYRDEHLWMKDDNGDDFAYEYRPAGIYMFPSAERANAYAQGNNGDVYRVDTKANRREIIRDPSVAVNWDYGDEYDYAYVTRYVEPSALTLLGPVAKHLAGQHDQKTHARGTQQSIPGTEGTGRGPTGEYTEWGDRAAEIKNAAHTGMSEEDLRNTLYPDPASLDPAFVREQVESEYEWEIDDEVEERMSRTLLMEDEDEVNATREAYREEVLDDYVRYHGDEVAARVVEESFDSDKVIEDFQEVYGGVYHEGVTKDGRTVALITDVTEAWGPQGGDDSIDIKGQITDADTGNYVGRFHRRFEPDREGGVTVTHELLEIDEEYQGTGFAGTFNRQAENYYISHGINTVNVHAALDGGGYAWASQGFDWDYRNHDKSRGNMNRRLDLYEQNVPGIPNDLRRDMARLRTRLNDLSVTDPDYPTPKEIADLGRIEGVSTWPGKVIMRGSNWYGTKTLTPQGARQSTTQRAAATRRRAQEAYEAERRPGRGQKTMDRDFLEGALSQATTATTPLFPPIPGVVE